ncbi:MAG TPA: nuclear transport factor 2 family protein [Gemmatimonadales bacterium]|jgi:hypothetical protein
MTEADAQRFAVEWVEAWNTRDLERILWHYAEDVEVTSPFVETVLGPGQTTVIGKPALRAYWSPILARYPDLHFVLHRAYAGVDSVVLHYQSIQGLMSAECMELDANGRIRRVQAHYAMGPDPAAA